MISSIEDKLSSGGLDGKEIKDLSIELGIVIERIEEFTLAWMELAEKE